MNAIRIVLIVCVLAFGARVALAAVDLAQRLQHVQGAQR